MKKIKLVERYFFTPQSKDIVMYNEQESLSFKESVKGKDFYGLAKIKNVPISNYEKNSNDRIYPYNEWKKAVKEGTKTYCFADHPEDGKETVNSITGIWENIRVNEEDVRGDLVVFDNENGRTLLHCAKNGLCEFSTSGWGNLDETNVVYDFELERASDWVYNRSNPIAVITDKSKEVEIIEKNEKMKESFKTYNTNNKNIIEEGIMENTALTQLNENMIKTQRNHIKRIIKEAEKSGSYIDAIEELQSLEPYSKDITDMISGSIADMGSKLSEKQEVVLKEAEKAKTNVTKLSETVKKQDIIIAKLKESLEKANKIIKGKSSGSDSLKETIFEMAKDLDEVFYVLENRTIKKLGIDKPQEFVALAEDSVKMEKLLKQFKEKYKNLKESAETMKGTDKSKKLLKKYKESLDDALFDLDVLAQILEKKNINIMKEAKAILEKKGKKKEADDEEMEDEDEDEDDDEDEEEVAEKKSSKKSKKESSTKKLIKAFFKEKKRQVPSISRIEREIMSCSSLTEAYKLVEKYTKPENEKIRVSESVLTKHYDPFSEYD